MRNCNECFHYEACKKIFQIAFKDFTNYIFFKSCELYVSTSDVAEVVRCKNCDIPHNKWTGCPKLNGLIPPPNHFCACGERKKEGAE